MSRDLHLDLGPEAGPAPCPPPPAGDVVLRSPPNWVAVIFLSILGAVHLSVAAMSIAKGRWECYLSVALGGLFVVAAAVATRLRFELAFLPARRRVRLRYGLRRRLHLERFIPFSRVRGVRLTSCGGRKGQESLVELLCPDEDVLCPPTDVPRQEALCLAVLMGVPLIKVSEEAPDESGRADVGRFDPVSSNRR